ncbi:hypothetical protein D3C84_495870 [compost metagenome]
METSTICQTNAPLISGCLRERGGLRMVFSSVGSNASAMPSVTAVIRLIHRICIGVTGNVRPSSKATMMVMVSPALVGSVQLSTFLMLS